MKTYVTTANFVGDKTIVYAGSDEESAYNYKSEDFIVSMYVEVWEDGVIISNKDLVGNDIATMKKSKALRDKENGLQFLQEEGYLTIVSTSTDYVEVLIKGVSHKIIWDRSINCHRLIDDKQGLRTPLSFYLTKEGLV